MGDGLCRESDTDNVRLAAMLFTRKSSSNRSWFVYFGIWLQKTMIFSTDWVPTISNCVVRIFVLITQGYNVHCPLS